MTSRYAFLQVMEWTSLELAITLPTCEYQILEGPSLSHLLRVDQRISLRIYTYIRR